MAAIPYIAVLAAGYGAYSSYSAAGAQGDAQQAQAENNSLNSVMSAELADYNAEVTRQLAYAQAEYGEKKALFDAWSTSVQGDYESNILFSNAKIANRNSANVRESTAYTSARIEDRNKRDLATQRTQFSASGVKQTGSAEDVMYDSALQGELDVLANEYSGSIEALGYEYQADMAEWQGNITHSMADINAAMTLWSGSEQAKLTRAAGDANATSLLMQGNQYRANAQQYSAMGPIIQNATNQQQTAAIVNGVSSMFSSYMGTSKVNTTTPVNVSGSTNVGYMNTYQTPPQSSGISSGLRINDIRIVA